MASPIRLFFCPRLDLLNPNRCHLSKVFRLNTLGERNHKKYEPSANHNPRQPSDPHRYPQHLEEIYCTHPLRRESYFLPAKPHAECLFPKLSEQIRRALTFGEDHSHELESPYEQTKHCRKIQ